jgi:hypothetical protein
MATRYIEAAADATAVANLIQNLSPQVAGICFKRDDNTLGVLDPDTGTVIYVPLGITVTAAQINQMLGAANGVAGISLPKVAYARYDFAVDGGGAPGLITPATNSTIPANAIITSVVINSTTAVTSGGTTTVSIGLSAGAGGAAALLAATAKASFTTDALLAGIPIPNDATKWIKMSAAGTITLTSATTAIGAGVIEIFVFYVTAANA